MRQLSQLTKSSPQLLSEEHDYANTVTHDCLRKAKGRKQRSWLAESATLPAALLKLQQRSRDPLRKASCRRVNSIIRIIDRESIDHRPLRPFAAHG